MLISAGQQDLDPAFGPKIYVNSSLGEANRSAVIDTDALGENLQMDFPELTQSDWDHNIIYVTDTLHKDIGGFTIDVTGLHHRSGRMIYAGTNLARWLFSPLNSAEYPSAKWVLRQSLGQEVLTVLNLSSDLNNVDDHLGIFNSDNPPTLSNVLAHELHHATGMLLANRLNRDRQDSIRRLRNKAVLYMGGALGGITAASVGFITAIETLGDGVALPASSAGVMLAGVALASTTVYRAAKKDALSLEAAGIDVPAPKYSEGEMAASAYALATDDSWSRVVSL